MCENKAVKQLFSEKSSKIVWFEDNEILTNEKFIFETFNEFFYNVVESLRIEDNYQKMQIWMMHLILYPVF